MGTSIPSVVPANGQQPASTVAPTSPTARTQSPQRNTDGDVNMDVEVNSLTALFAGSSLGFVPKAVRKKVKELEKERMDVTA
jgi:hypothetical protein